MAPAAQHAPSLALTAPAALRPSECAAVTALLRSDAAFPLMLHAVETARFDAYTRDERLELMAILRARTGARIARAPAAPHHPRAIFGADGASHADGALRALPGAPGALHGADGATPRPRRVLPGA